MLKLFVILLGLVVVYEDEDTLENEKKYTFIYISIKQ